MTRKFDLCYVLQNARRSTERCSSPAMSVLVGWLADVDEAG